MKNGSLQNSLANVVIKWRSGLTEKQGEAVPVFEQVADGAAQTGVGLDPLLLHLIIQPLLQLVRHRAAVLLVIDKPFLRREPLFSGQRVMVIDLAQGLQHVSARIGEIRRDLDKPSPCVGVILCTR